MLEIEKILQNLSPTERIVRSRVLSSKQKYGHELIDEIAEATALNTADVKQALKQLLEKNVITSTEIIDDGER